MSAREGAIKVLEAQADALDAFRASRLCCYGADRDHTCDCKYPLPDRKPSSEVTGCPELRSIEREIQEAVTVLGWIERHADA